MTDRINVLTVALERDIRDDDIQPLIDAISQLRGVLKVETHVKDPMAWATAVRVKHEIHDRIFQVLKDYPDE